MLRGYKSKIIANGNDPHIVFALSDLDESQIIFVDTKSNWHDDANTCPKCGELLDWNEKSHFISPSCGFSSPKSMTENSTKLIEDITKSLRIPGAWNVNNALLAHQTCVSYDVPEKQIFESWESVREVSGRNAIFKLDNGKTFQLFLAKNPAGWNETLSHISKQPDSETIFAFNCNIADGKDPSWLYDVDFENAKLNEVIVFGERRIDMQLRLEIASKKVTSDFTSHFQKH